MTYIRHLTLTTGHVRDSHPGEVSAETLDAMRPHLAAALAAQDAPLPAPGLEQYSLSARVHGGRCLLAWVHRDEALLVTLGVALHSRCAPALWALLHDDADGLAIDAESRPGAPWCAVRLEAGLGLYADATEWLGDYERCLAWTWRSMRMAN